jgi:regulator of sigma E protease
MSGIESFLSALPYFVILIGLLIFVHEGGHFIFAKLFGVKVHVFSLGFGPKLVGFTRGETLYKISLVPVGGYVKMLGEDPTEEIAPEDKGRAFGDKPAFQRFLIIIGGPVMNIVFPLFVHFGAGLSLTEVVPAEAGVVLPGTPAWEAGIRPGDVIESIDGQKVYSFDDLIELVSPRPGQEINVTVRRGSQTFERTVVPAPTEVPIILEEKETIGKIGIGPGYLPPLIGVSQPDSAAALAGLETFDLIVLVDGDPILRLVDLERKLIKTAGSTATLDVKHIKADAKPPFEPFVDQFSKESRKVEIRIPEHAKSLADLGIESSADYVAFVTPGGAAEKIGLKRGDRLVSLDGRPFPMGQIFMALDEAPQMSRTLAWTRDGQRFESSYQQTFVPAGEAGDLGLDRDRYDKGFWSIAGMSILPDLVPNQALVSTAFKYAISETWAGIRIIGIGMKLLFQGKVSLRSLGGPLMIGQMAGQAGQQGMRTFFWMMALISLNLGLINLLPIPVLDGGQIVFIAIESVTRQPISRVVKERVMLVGVAMILLLMVFATWNDIARLVVG